MKLLLVIALLLTAGVGNGQPIIVANIKMNIAYLGVPNPMQIMVNGYGCDDLIVSTDNGTIKYERDCRYTYMPARAGQTEISIKSKTGKPLGSTTYRVKYIPDPVPTIGNKPGGRIQKTFLQTQLGIVLTLSGFDFDYRMLVTHFKATIIRNSNVMFVESTNGPKFNPNMIKAFYTLKANDIVIFSEIQARGPDSRTRSFHDMEFFITD